MAAVHNQKQCHLPFESHCFFCLSGAVWHNSQLQAVAAWRSLLAQLDQKMSSVHRFAIQMIAELLTSYAVDRQLNTAPLRHSAVSAELLMLRGKRRAAALETKPPGMS